MGTTTILGIFDNRDAARRALDELRASAIQLHDTSLVAQGELENGERLTAPEGAVFGAAWGGLVGLVALAIPGIGPFIAGGAIAAALTGAAAGAVVGGIGGALMHSTNLSSEEAQRYEGAVRQGKTLVIIKSDEEDALEVRRILAHDGAESIRENQSDLMHAGRVEVTMYNEGGQPVHHSPSYGAVNEVVRPADAFTPASTVTYGGSSISTREETLDTADAASDVLGTTSTSGREANFEDEDRPAGKGTMANGARITSYEDADKSKSVGDGLKDV